MHADLRFMKCVITDVLRESEGGRGILCPKNTKVAFMKLNDEVRYFFRHRYMHFTSHSSLAWHIPEGKPPNVETGWNSHARDHEIQVFNLNLQSAIEVIS